MAAAITAMSPRMRARRSDAGPPACRFAFATPASVTARSIVRTDDKGYPMKKAFSIGSIAA